MGQPSVMGVKIDATLEMMQQIIKKKTSSISNKNKNKQINLILQK